MNKKEPLGIFHNLSDGCFDAGPCLWRGAHTMYGCRNS